MSGKRKKDALMDQMFSMIEDSADPDLKVIEPGDSQRAVVATIRSTGMHVEGFCLPLSEITTNKDQIRKDFDEHKLNLLAESIRVNGLLQPIAVERCMDGKNLCIDGERRFKALQIIKDSGDFGKVDPSSIPVYTSLDTESDETLRLLLGLIANDMREDNSEADKARMISSLVKKGTPRELILQRTLITKGTVSKYIKVGNVLTGNALSLAGKAGMALTTMYELSIASQKVIDPSIDQRIVDFIENNQSENPTVKRWAELIAKEFNQIKNRTKKTTRPTIMIIGSQKIKWVKRRNGIHLEMDKVSEKLFDKISELIKKDQSTEVLKQ